MLILLKINNNVRFSIKCLNNNFIQTNGSFYSIYMHNLDKMKEKAKGAGYEK
jgi:hypothetical protein